METQAKNSRNWSMVGVQGKPQRWPPWLSVVKRRVPIGVSTCYIINTATLLLERLPRNQRRYRRRISAYEMVYWSFQSSSNLFELLQCCLRLGGATRVGVTCNVWTLPRLDSEHYLKSLSSQDHPVY
jgi:hypothetical protein